MRGMLRRNLLSAYFWAFVAYLFVPLVMMAAMGFSGSRFVSFPIRSWTPEHYLLAFSDREMNAALIASVKVALGATALSLVVGVPMGFAVARLRGGWRAGASALVLLPAFIPVVVAAVALRMFIGVLGLAPGLPAVIFGHAVSTVPFVAIMVLTRLNAMPANHAEAARDLGADEIVIFFRITLPFLAPSIVGGVIFCLLLSFEDFVRSFFLTGFQPTFPVLMFSRLRLGFGPDLAAISAVVLAVTLALAFYAERVTRLRKAPQTGDDDHG